MLVAWSRAMELLDAQALVYCLLGNRYHYHWCALRFSAPTKP